jgi:hypothetical protein
MLEKLNEKLDVGVFLNNFSIYFLLRILLLIILLLANLWFKSIRFLCLSIIFVILLIGYEDTKLIIKVIYNTIFKLPLSNTAKIITQHANINFIHNLEKINEIKSTIGPVVFVSNYPSSLAEYPMYSLFDSYMIINKKVANKIPFWVDSKKIIPMSSKQGFDFLKTKLTEHILVNKNSAFCYWEKSEKNFRRKHLYDLGETRTGIFYICQELQIPIVPVVIDRIITHNGFIIRQNFRIKVGNPYKIKNTKRTITNLNEHYKKYFNFFASNKYSYTGYGFFK